MSNNYQLLQDTSVPVKLELPVTDEKSKPQDPFKGHFAAKEMPPAVETMIKSRSASRWIRDIHQMVNNEVYSFQQTLMGKSGPEVFSNNREMYMLSSYDYLGLLGHPHIEKFGFAPSDQGGNGATIAELKQ